MQEDRGGPYRGGAGAVGRGSAFPNDTALGEGGTVCGKLLEYSLPSASNITADSFYVYHNVKDTKNLINIR